MKVALVGYGKMGKQIEPILLDREHQVSWKIEKTNREEISKINSENTDVAIEFTGPDTAFQNCQTLITNRVPVISGSTGWQDQFEELTQFVKEQGGTFLYASNFSLGVNIFFKLNKWLGGIMKQFNQYSASIEETHHIHKLDSPSGTAIEIENQLNIHQKIPIKSVREGEVPGTHIVSFRSEVDEIQVKHEAFGREGFALGAVIVAEWIKGKKGVFTMDDFLKF